MCNLNIICKNDSRKSECSNLLGNDLPHLCMHLVSFGIYIVLHLKRYLVSLLSAELH